MFTAITKRRSIRKYKEETVPRELVEKVLQAGCAAPSSKNRQPWKFIVVSGSAKEDAISAMQKGLEREKTQPFLPESAQYVASAQHTAHIMAQAPVLIFVVNPLGLDFQSELTPEQRIFEICNAQSVGASIENMTLTATELGLGSLWICDTFFAHTELKSWLKTEGELFAVLALGYAAEAPAPRPRKAWEEVVEWRTREEPKG